MKLISARARHLFKYVLDFTLVKYHGKKGEMVLPPFYGGSILFRFRFIAPYAQRICLIVVGPAISRSLVISVIYHFTYLRSNNGHKIFKIELAD